MGNLRDKEESEQTYKSMMLPFHILLEFLVK